MIIFSMCNKAKCKEFVDKEKLFCKKHKNEIKNIYKYFSTQVVNWIKELEEKDNASTL